MTPRARVQHGPAHPDDDAPVDATASATSRIGIALAAGPEELRAGRPLLWVLPARRAADVVRLALPLPGAAVRRGVRAARRDRLEPRAPGWHVAPAPRGPARPHRSRSRAAPVHRLGRAALCRGGSRPRSASSRSSVSSGPASRTSRPRARLRHRTASFVSVHPVLVGAFLGVVVGAFAARDPRAAEARRRGSSRCSPPRPAGSSKSSSPASARRAWAARLAASPGARRPSAVSPTRRLANTAFAQKVHRDRSGPRSAAVLCYRAVVRRTGRPGGRGRRGRPPTACPR